MITLTREEAQQVLDALDGGGWTVKDYAVELLRSRLSASKEWQSLTDEEIDKALWDNESDYLPDIIRVAEAKLKEKNT